MEQLMVPHARHTAFRKPLIKSDKQPEDDINVKKKTTKKSLLSVKYRSRPSSVQDLAPSVVGAIDGGFVLQMHRSCVCVCESASSDSAAVLRWETPSVSASRAEGEQTQGCNTLS